MYSQIFYYVVIVLVASLSPGEVCLLLSSGCFSHTLASEEIYRTECGILEDLWILFFYCVAATMTTGERRELEKGIEYPGQNAAAHL